MSANAGARVESPEVEVSDNYEEMVEVLDTLLDECIHKVESGRVYDAENEKVRIKWIRITKDVVDVKRKVTQERDLVELQKQVAELQKRQEEQTLL